MILSSAGPTQSLAQHSKLPAELRFGLPGPEQPFPVLQGGGSGDFNNVGQNQGGGGYSGGYGGPGQPPANVNVTGHDERGESCCLQLAQRLASTCGLLLTATAVFFRGCHRVLTVCRGL